MANSQRAEVQRENRRRFRNACRDEQIGPRYSGLAHLGLISLGYAAAIVLALRFAHGRDPHAIAQAWWLVPLAWVSANLAEYWLHRGPMHHKHKRSAGLQRLYKRHAATHHRFFTHVAMSVDGPRDYAIIFFPAWMHAFFIFGLGAPLVLGLGLVLGPARACVFAAGIASYIFSYEWLHLAAHLPASFGVRRWPILGGVARHHRRHHEPARMRHVNFSIFLPLGDLLFGTLSQRDSPGRSVDEIDTTD